MDESNKFLVYLTTNSAKPREIRMGGEGLLYHAKQLPGSVSYSNGTVGYASAQTQFSAKQTKALDGLLQIA